METECPICGEKFKPTDQQLQEAGWHYESGGFFISDSPWDKILG